MSSTEMRDCHRFFLQKFMSHGMLGVDDVNATYKEGCVRYGEVELLEMSGPEALVSFLNAINVKINELHLEIKKARDECTGDFYYVLVNKMDSDITKLSQEFTTDELDLFKKLLEKLCTSDTGLIPSSEALNLTDQIDKPKRLSKADAEKFYERLHKEHWLGVKNGCYYLSARSITELEPYILDQFEVAKCNVCQRLCVQGQRCDLCSTTLHICCAAKLFRGKAVPRCPNSSCNALWPVVQPQSDIADGEEGTQNGGSMLPPTQRPRRKRRA